MNSQQIYKKIKKIAEENKQESKASFLNELKNIAQKILNCAENRKINDNPSAENFQKEMDEKLLIDILKEVEEIKENSTP